LYYSTRIKLGLSTSLRIPSPEQTPFMKQVFPEPRPPWKDTVEPAGRRRPNASPMERVRSGEQLTAVHSVISPFKLFKRSVSKNHPQSIEKQAEYNISD